ncbi:hypothetical protein OG453_38035 [Streptomyces sp. NBC_01381]|uniref:hypothetical protein n=1 Tax=Streptomyces sp. NBC_01381 TaxID=2903845 RepID=UPI00224EC9F7|nr:hypothetical protein [Streptomyces sp. NBC_01381]MCX4672394.1 hypothetical protein [Streptomyces sp. NBC_01381]
MQPVGPDVWDVGDREFGDAGLDADTVLAETARKIGGLGVLGQRNGAAEIVGGALVQAVQDAAGLVPLDVPEHGRLSRAEEVAP